MPLFCPNLPSCANFQTGLFAIQAEKGYVEGVENPDLGRLSIECMLWASLQPEVPVYFWKEDTLWPQVPKRIGQAEVYAQKLEACVAETESQAAELWTLKQLVAAQKATLLFLQQGQLSKAEAEQTRARQLETQLAEMLSLFSWPKVEHRPVYNRATQVSRYDSVDIDEGRGTVQVFCAFRGCKKPQTLEFSRSNSWYRHTCMACGRSFLVFIARLMQLQTTDWKGHRRYVLRLEDAQHKHVRVEFVDGSGDIWQVVERDYLALLYAWHHQVYAWNSQEAMQTKRNTELNALVNLTRRHVFWLSRVGHCFVATAFLGEGAIELVLFRRFRDEVLLSHFWGKWGVAAYYALGPFAARLLLAQPWLRTPMRRLLKRIYHKLQAALEEGGPFN
ncbi:MAG: hypothetical protein FWD46_05915 [Cystobacterineae bacterium]|nr:hypothetical protein [Cystobacterineae bacterium]